MKPKESDPPKELLIPILMTGADGFAGRFLSRELAATNAEIHGTCYQPRENLPPNVIYHRVDLRDEQAVDDLIANVQPTQIYHLAGTANVGQSFSASWSTLENNIRSQLNLTLACLKHGLQPRILVISSGDIYGDQLLDHPATENTSLRPSNPYSVSKVTQDMLALQYFLSHDLPFLRARPSTILARARARASSRPISAFRSRELKADSKHQSSRLVRFLPSVISRMSVMSPTPII